MAATTRSGAAALPVRSGEKRWTEAELAELREELETELIKYAITHYRGQMSEVARRLCIGRSTLYRKLEALGLNTERDEAPSESVAAERQPEKIDRITPI